jgi:hypothetical protein
MLFPLRVLTAALEKLHSAPHPEDNSRRNN